MVLSDRQLEEITRIVQDNHSAFLIQLGLGEAVSEEQTNRLLKLGLVTKSQVRKSLVEDAFMFGLLADSLQEGQAKKLNLEQFKQWLALREVPLNADERAAVKMLRRSLTTHVKDLGGRVDVHTHKVLVEADQDLRRRLAGQLKRELTAAVEQKKSLSDIVDNLRKATGRYSHEWQRIAMTELNNAFQEGKLATIQKSNKGSDPWVFKRVKPSCCEECKDAYVTKSGAPKLFRLSELLAAGSNIGRAKGDRRATVKSLHPWCQCELQEMPPGFEFNSKGRMVFVGLGT